MVLSTMDGDLPERATEMRSSFTIFLASDGLVRSGVEQ